MKPMFPGDTRTSVYVNSRMLFLAKEVKGLKNFSEFCELCLESFVLSDKPTVAHPVNDYVKEILTRLTQDLRSQKKLIQDEETARQEIEDYRAQREKATHQAATRVFLKHHNFARYLPENDPDLDRVDEFERAVSEISRLAGYDVDPAEVIRIYHQETNTQPVSSRETAEDVFGRRSLS